MPTHPGTGFDDCLLIIARHELGTQRAETLRQALAALGFRGTPKQAEAFYLVRVLGRSGDEAAAETGVPDETLAARLSAFDRNCSRPAPCAGPAVTLSDFGNAES